MRDVKSLASEIEAVLRKHVVGADAKNAHRHELLAALSEAADEIAREATAGESRGDELEKLRKENKYMRTELDALIQEVLRNGER